MAKLGWNSKQRGQLLIEAMVAVSLMLVGLLGIFGVLSRSLGLSRVAADQFVAVNLASEGIEIAKNLLDSNIKQGLAWNSNFVDGGDGGREFDVSGTSWNIRSTFALLGTKQGSR